MVSEHFDKVLEFDKKATEAIQKLAFDYWMSPKDVEIVLRNMANVYLSIHEGQEETNNGNGAN